MQVFLQGGALYTIGGRVYSVNAVKSVFLARSSGALMKVWAGTMQQSFPNAGLRGQRKISPTYGALLMV